MTNLQALQFRQSLKQWTFKAVDESEWLPATVPGTVHTDLLDNGKISNPFYGTNEKDVQWIDKKDWEYITTIDVEAPVLNHSHIELVFAGLDTYADVYVNEQHVLSADNMFRTWRADVKPYVKLGANDIRIHFRSPIMEDLPKLKALGYGLPASNDQSEVGELGDQRVSVFARKAPYHYGWDWGPRFVTSGIWREAELVAWSDVRIENVYIRQNQVHVESADLTAVVQIYSEQERQVNLRVYADGQNWEQTVTLAEGTDAVQIPLLLDNPKLWWSRGLGDAHLYTFTVEVLEQNQTLAVKSERTGIRSIRLVTEPHPDYPGTSFYFELNGVPVFAKGANHIPNDSFSPRVTLERYRHEIVTAVESNMNMLRVWGGGIYENDEFYDLCDEYGILVWQDFMFACSMYPGDEEFLDSVQAEAEDNIRRLRNHPSIVLWCGNNEIDSAWSQYVEDGGWGWKKDYNTEQRAQIWADYESLFHELLPEVVRVEHPGISYWPSSPIVAVTNNEKQHTHGITDSGDIHYWGVWHNSEPFERYNTYIGRFMSEYGFQSFPEYKSVRTYAEESDLELESEVMLRHQKNGAGNRLIKEYMDKYLPAPKDFPSFLYMSQVLQAEAMKTAIEAHRRRKPYCMGTLYWQMNDCWPVASWSSMDYYGRWKAVQYYAKRSFEDILLSIDNSVSGTVNIHLVSDLIAPKSLTVRVKVLGIDGTLYKEMPQSLTLAGGEAIQLLSLTTEQLLGDVNPAEAILVAELEHENQLLHTEIAYFVSATELPLQQPNIQVVETEVDGVIAYELTTDVLARQIWLNTASEGIFSDNFFDLIPGVTKTVQFKQLQTLEDVHHANEMQSESNIVQPSVSHSPQFVPAKPEDLQVQSMADFIHIS
ncbi:glycoside hydrolase family 2 TIM barrel-domain containing protein [Paenibacillus sp. KACC 21273]|uniref:beta-mannosidase n=1 Tax=Paenibacillus sp. KACC 21273 TaxID=3025665 RepID=UPI0023658D3F|nr:glycoside hydrolase family 2 protein [Paenibacillus sp. KACC 21273]WDF52509.1 glycoside hydrolase family 2 TIM barrel-domain containing protein [Paenibacillus sp. KACC 21273]